MNKRAKVLIAGASVLAIGAGTAGVALGTASDDDASERPIKGGAVERASAAALDHTGEGRVSATEVGDEESYYEVEVTLNDGSEVDVQLDRGFNVVGDEADGNESEGSEEGSE